MWTLHSSSAALLGTREVINGVETVWQKPTSSVATRGLLLVAHGCNHGAIDFWPRSDACTQCIGLPEEVRITTEALQAGWAVVAMSSAIHLSDGEGLQPFAVPQGWMAEALTDCNRCFAYTQSCTQKADVWFDGGTPQQ